MSIDISVIIPTYNRASELTRTIEGMVNCEKRDLTVEFVVVDNGSRDQTKQVVDSFSSRLPTRYLFEARPGKSRALNTALETVELGDIVVFTDDDVDPSREWLVSIISACKRWPNHSVFGGRINVAFPTDNVPKWVFESEIYERAFGYHNYWDEERIYASRLVPFGANFWVRKEILSRSRKFNEEIGPVAGHIIPGEDMSFLTALFDEGFEIVYAPSAVVTHRIQSDSLRLSRVCRRVYQAGRGEAYVLDLPRPELLRRNPTLWRAHRIASIAFHAAMALPSLLCPDKDQRSLNVAMQLYKLGYRVEGIRQAGRVLTKLRAK